MRFLIYTQYFPPEMGAAQTRLAAQARELIKAGHEVEIVTALPNYLSKKIFPGYQGRYYCQDEWEGCKVHRFWVFASQGKGFWRVVNYLSFIATTFFGIYRAARPDWIFVNSGPLFLVIPAYVASRYWGVPFILNISDLWAKSVTHLEIFKNRWFLQLLKVFEKWSYKKADVITVVTEGIRQEIITNDGVPSNKICFLPNGVDSQLFYPRAPSVKVLKQYNLAGKKVFVYPGTHGYAHALENVLIAAKLLQHDTRIHFMFIGGGSEKDRLVKIAETEKLHNVTFVDSLPLPELAEHLSVACCGLIHQKNTPLANETRPAKSYPLMAMGIPILFAGFGEGADIVAGAEAGVVIEPEKPLKLRDKILEIIDDYEQLVRWGNNGRELALRQFSWEANVKKWLAELMPLTTGVQPLVSIVTPAFNSARFIGDAINSVCSQTYQNWEMIVVDDGSEDKTAEIVARASMKDQRIRLIRAPAQGGVASARNLGLQNANGRFVAFLDSDDLWVADKLETQLNYMLRGGYALTYGRFRRVSENGKRVGRLLPVPHTVSYHELLCHNILGTLTVMIDRQQVGQVQMCEEKHEDFILWLRLIREGYTVFGIQKDLARYRMVGGSVSHNKMRAARWVWRIYRRIERLNFFKAAWCFVNYLLRVSYKYSRF